MKMPGKAFQVEGTAQAKVQGWKIQNVLGATESVLWLELRCIKGRAGDGWARSMGPDNGGPQTGG